MRDALGRYAGKARRRWRRSLRVRVVGTTLLTAGLVVVLLASLLVERIGDGLIEAKTRTALTEAQSGVSSLQDSLIGVSDVESALIAQVEELSRRGAAGDLFTVVQRGTSPRSATRTTRGTEVSDVPDELLQAVLAADDDRARYVYAEVPDGRGGRVEGIVVGFTLDLPARQPGESYQVFELFPLTQERETLGLLRRTAVLAGTVLVLLLALISYVIVRQVVTPVRMAAKTAERLAAGRLSERLQVTGEDELARLGTSFNSMAGALQKQIVQLEELSRVQRRFVSDVSHELRTPLTTVRMAADLLHEARETFPPDTRRSAELLQTELDRFEALLVDLLEISRIDAGATALEAEEQDLITLARRVLAHTKGLSERSGSSVELRAPRSLIVEIDHVRVERILRNLVVNALEHGEGRPVHLEVSEVDGTAVVLVRDHGIGLKPGDSERVFERFWRGDPSRARTTGGTGLGLAIAQEDARLHGGSLDAWGEPGQGAAFRLVLPRVLGGPLADLPELGPHSPAALR